MQRETKARECFLSLPPKVQTVKTSYTCCIISIRDIVIIIIDSEMAGLFKSLCHETT